MRMDKKEQIGGVTKIIYVSVNDFKSEWPNHGAIKINYWQKFLIWLKRRF